MLNFCPDCGNPWSQTKFCAHCGANLSNFLEGADPVTYRQATQSHEPFSLETLDFGVLTTEADKTAKALSLSAFLTEEQGDGQYAIVGLKRKNELRLTVPDCVSSIGESAFEGCTAMEIFLPEGLLLIGKRAFAHAKYLEKLTIPSSVRIIDDEAFAGCERLEVNIPDGVRQGKYVIKDTLTYKRAVEQQNKALEEEREKSRLLWQEIMQKNEEIAREMATRRAEEAQKAEEAKRAEEERRLKAEFEANWTIRGNRLVKYKGNSSYVYIPECVTEIGVEAFKDHKTVETVVLHDKVKSICASAFENCLSLKNIEIPESVTMIGAWAFAGCKNISMLYIPQSVTSIGDDAFDGMALSLAYTGTATGLRVLTIPRRYDATLSRLGINRNKTHVTLI